MLLKALHQFNVSTDETYLFFFTLSFQGLPVQQDFLDAMWRAKGCGVLASLPVRCAAGHGFNPDGTVCCAGGERPAGSSVWGLLWRGQYLVWDEFTFLHHLIHLEGNLNLHQRFCYYIVNPGNISINQYHSVLCYILYHDVLSVLFFPSLKGCIPVNWLSKDMTLR